MKTRLVIVLALAMALLAGCSKQDSSEFRAFMREAREFNSKVGEVKIALEFKTYGDMPDVKPQLDALEKALPLKPEKDTERLNALAGMIWVGCFTLNTHPGDEKAKQLFLPTLEEDVAKWDPLYAKLMKKL
jgi:hypothetical protein